MNADEMLRRWAEQRFGIERVVRVEFKYDAGFGGSDVTPADPEELVLIVEGAAGEHLWLDDLKLVPSLILEIVEFAQRPHVDV